jgi:S1-C subfamily serine protease
MKKIAAIVFIVFPMLAGCVSNGPAKSNDLDTGLRNATVKITIKQNGNESSTGSGFVINYKNENYIITNFHVIGYNDPDSIVISRKNRQERFETFYNPEIIVEDVDDDIAVLKLPESDSWNSHLALQNNRQILQTIVISGFPPHAE